MYRYADAELLYADIIWYEGPADELPVAVKSGYFLGEELNKYLRAGYGVENVHKAGFWFK